MPSDSPRGIKAATVAHTEEDAAVTGTQNHREDDD